MESGGRAEWEMSVEGIMLTYHKTTEEEKYGITEWKYPGEYAVYDSTPYEEQKKEALGLPILRTIFTLFMTKRRWSVLSIYTKRKQKSFSESA